MTLTARVGDTVSGVCCAHSNPTCISTTGIIVQGAGTVNSEGQPIARVSDTVALACGHTAIIVSSNATVSAEGILVARIGDSVGGVFTGTIVSSAATVNAE